MVLSPYFSAGSRVRCGSKTEVERPNSEFRFPLNSRHLSDWFGASIRCRGHLGYRDQRATILLRIDWLSGLIGALLW